MFQDWSTSFISLFRFAQIYKKNAYLYFDEILEGFSFEWLPQGLNYERELSWVQYVSRARLIAVRVAGGGDSLLRTEQLLSVEFINLDQKVQSNFLPSR